MTKKKVKTAFLTGAERIAKERLRQIEQEGWTPDHDDDHCRSEMTRAAICYAASAAELDVYQKRGYRGSVTFSDPWPDDWSINWDKRPRLRSGQFKLDNKVHVRIRMLEKAGALIAAEIDRLLRQLPKK